MGVVHLAHPLLAQQSLTRPSGTPAFPSPADAVQSLLQAVQSSDIGAIERVLGGPTDLASSRQDDQDKLDREVFVKKYQEMHRLHREADASVTLYIGAENWPFPIPLVEQGGAWHFDPEAGRKEVLFRRIGENELKAIEMCRELAAAQNQSASDGNSAGVLIQGYYFRVLSQTGKTAAVSVVAYPAQYRLSGVMTFILTGNSVIYEKDLGANTSALASALTKFHKDVTWSPVAE
jgi:hypothetical protein